MNVFETELPGVKVLKPRVHADTRGYLYEHYQAERYAAYGIADFFVQDNVTRSWRGVLRGLHLQHPQGQAKLVAALMGEVFDVAVDVRRGSPTFGRWTAVLLSAENRKQLYIPEGFAHGFCVLSEEALVLYKCGCTYNPATSFSIAWNDPDIAIPWPVENPLLSEADRGAPFLAGIDLARLPLMDAGNGIVY